MHPRLLLALTFVCVSTPALARPFDADARCKEAESYKERSAAAEKEGRLSDAMIELGQAVSLCPTDEAAQKQLVALREQVMAQELKERGARGPRGPGGRRGPGGMGPGGMGPPGTGAPGEERPESPFGSAREELVLVQGLHGALWGAAVGLTLTGGSNVLGPDSQTRSQDATAMLLGAMLGGSTGSFFSGLLSRGPMPLGTVTALNSGTLWGTGLAVSYLLSQDGGPVLLIPAGAAAGTLVGGLAGMLLRPSAGQVALTNTVGMWSAVLSTFALSAVEPGRPVADHLRVAAMSAGAGLLAGGLAAPWLKVSRLRMFYVDLGGAAGLGLGLAAVGLMERSLPRTRNEAIGVGAATLTGLLLAAVLTHGMDAPKPAPAVSLVPNLAPGAAGLSMLGTF